MMPLIPRPPRISKWGTLLSEAFRGPNNSTLILARLSLMRARWMKGFLGREWQGQEIFRDLDVEIAEIKELLK